MTPMKKDYIETKVKLLRKFYKQNFIYITKKRLESKIQEVKEVAVEDVVVVEKTRMPEIFFLVLKMDVEEEEEKVERAIQEIMIVGMISHKWSTIIAPRMDI